MKARDFGNVNYKSRDLNVESSSLPRWFTIDILRSYITGVFVQVCCGICVGYITSDNEKLCPVQRTKTVAHVGEKNCVQFEIKTTEIDF